LTDLFRLLGSMICFQRDSGMVDQTSEEMKISNMAKMGDALGEIYSALWQKGRGAPL